MIKRAAAVLALLALLGLLPAAAQEAERKMTVEAVAQAEEKVEEMAEKAEEMAEDAAEKVEQAVAPDVSLEKVLAAHYKALGGTEAWQEVESVQFEGTMSVGPGMDAPFKMTMKRPANIRLEFTFQGMTGIQASDGETAWMVMPFMGKNDPEKMPAEMAVQLEEQADIEGPLFGWKDKGHTVELVGAEELEGTEVYKVKLTRENGDVRYHYLDRDYHLTIKQTGKTKMQGQELEIETAIGDYKKLCFETSTLVDEENPCEGKVLLLPFSIESKAKGAPSAQTITINGVAINPEIADDYFNMPAKTEQGSAEKTGA